MSNAFNAVENKNESEYTWTMDNMVVLCYIMGQVIFHCLSHFELERARRKTCTLCRTHTRNRAIMHKQVAGFSDFNEGLIIRENIKMTQKSSKIPNWCRIRSGIIHGFHRRVWSVWYNLCIIRQYIHSKTAEHHVLFSKSINSSNFYPWSSIELAECGASGRMHTQYTVNTALKTVKELWHTHFTLTAKYLPYLTNLTKIAVSFGGNCLLCVVRLPSVKWLK